MPITEQKGFSPEELAVITEIVQKSEKGFEQNLTKTNWLMTGIVIVLFVGFLTMLIALGGVLWQAITFQGSTYQNLANEVRAVHQSIENEKRSTDELKSSTEILNCIKDKGYFSISCFK